MQSFQPFEAFMGTLICGQKEFCPLLVFLLDKPAALRAKQLENNV